YIVGGLPRMPSTKGLVRELNDNPSLCELCGFETIGHAGNLPRYRIPSRRTFGRVFKQLQQPEFLRLIEECMAELTLSMLEQVPDLGRDLAIDSTTIRTYANRRNGKDPEASFGFKHSVKAETGSERVLGYKYHVLSDYRGYFITGIFTTGSQHDSPMLVKLMKKMRRLFRDRIKPRTLAGDKAYDSNANYEFAHSNGIALLTPLRRLPKNELRDGRYTDDGVPTCHGLVMEHVRTDPETGKRLYRCPVDGHIPEGQMLPCAGEVEIDPTDNIRLFGGTIRRGSPEWDDKYEGRQGVERLFAWWKDRSLEEHYFRGEANVKLHTLLTVMAYLALQLAQLSGAVLVDKAA
ncbi:MAG: transposase, partial [Chloroflexi bacterium]|nr:transposase [Chloroflexota bacterium]